MVDGWRNVTLGELIDAKQALIQTGPFGSQLHAHDYRPVGVPVIPTEAIGHRRLRTDGIPRITNEKANDLSRHRLHAGDILFARRGVQATGYSAIVEPEHEGWLCGTGAILLRLHTKLIDPVYVSFVLAASATMDWLRQHAVGAVMPNLNEGILRRLALCLPSIQEQRAIARVLGALGALDDKIELNRRLNRSLEELAQAVFRSWFVDFDPVTAKVSDCPTVGLNPATAELFPDHFQDSELGEIPNGWNVVRLPELIEVNPKRSLPKGVVAPYFDMSNMPTSGHSALGWISRSVGSGMRFENGDTLVARITPCLENGKTAFVDFLQDGQVGWGSTEYIVLRPKPPIPDVFAYCLARSGRFRDFAIQAMTGSSGRQRVPPENLSKFRMVRLPDKVALAFGRAVDPLFSRATSNTEENRSLAAARDALLPPLLSGELRVPQAERLVEKLV